MIPTAIPDQIITYAGAAVYFGGAALLFGQSLRGGDAPRARRALAFVLLMWGLSHLFFSLNLPQITDPAYHPMSVMALIGGNAYIIICLLYPLELARPGWITARHVTRLLLPFLLVTGCYFFILALLDEPVRNLDSVASLLTNFGEFNVWYRFVFYISVCCYLVYMFLQTSLPTLDVRPLPGDEAPKPDLRRNARLRVYGASMLVTSLVYLIAMLFGTPELQFAHRILSAVLFGIVILSAARQGGMPAVSAETP